MEMKKIVEVFAQQELKLVNQLNEDIKSTGRASIATAEKMWQLDELAINLGLDIVEIPDIDTYPTLYRGFSISYKGGCYTHHFNRENYNS